MRQIFSSPRLENVEGVAALLNEHGIDTWISQARSYKGSRRRSFSYSDNARDATTPAAVWVKHAADQPQARALLREAGLLETTRGSYLPESATQPAAPKPVNHSARIRMVMLAAVVVLATFTSARSCNKPDTATLQPPAPPTHAPKTDIDPDPDRHIVPIDTSLL